MGLKTKKIIKKQILKEHIEMTNTPITENNIKHIWYSGFCLSDLFNFAEFDIESSFLPSKDDVNIKKFVFNKTDLVYILGDKVSKITKLCNHVIFDNVGDRSINEIFYNYFVAKFTKDNNDVNFYWIKSFNGKEKTNNEMVGIVVNDGLKGILHLRNNNLKKG